MVHFPNRNLSPSGFSVKVMMPRSFNGLFPTGPYLFLGLGQFIPLSWTPETTRETAATLRALADELDLAWAICDGTTKAQPEPAEVQPDDAQLRSQLGEG